MDFTAAHAGYVVAAYGISLAVIALMAGWVIRRDRHMQARIKQHDADRA